MTNATCIFLGKGKNVIIHNEYMPSKKFILNILPKEENMGLITSLGIHTDILLVDGELGGGLSIA